VDVIFGMPGDGIRGSPATAEFLLTGVYTASATIKQAAYAAPQFRSTHGLLHDPDVILQPFMNDCAPGVAGHQHHRQSGSNLASAFGDGNAINARHDNVRKQERYILIMLQ
jgi:hypothetical protein